MADMAALQGVLGRSDTAEQPNATVDQPNVAVSLADSAPTTSSVDEHTQSPKLDLSRSLDEQAAPASQRATQAVKAAHAARAGRAAQAVDSLARNDPRPTTSSVDEHTPYVLRLHQAVDDAIDDHTAAGAGQVIKLDAREAEARDETPEMDPGRSLDGQPEQATQAVETAQAAGAGRPTQAIGTLVKDDPRMKKWFLLLKSEESMLEARGLSSIDSIKDRIKGMMRLEMVRGTNALDPDLLDTPDALMPLMNAEASTVSSMGAMEADLREAREAGKKKAVQRSLNKVEECDGWLLFKRGELTAVTDLYPGKVFLDNRDGTYNVKFDDGDRDRAVPERSIKKLGGGGRKSDDDEKLREGDKVEARKQHWKRLLDAIGKNTKITRLSMEHLGTLGKLQAGLDEWSDLCKTINNSQSILWVDLDKRGLVAPALEELRGTELIVGARFHRHVPKYIVDRVTAKTDAGTLNLVDVFPEEKVGKLDEFHEAEWQNIADAIEKNTSIVKLDLSALSTKFRLVARSCPEWNQMWRALAASIRHTKSMLSLRLNDSRLHELSLESWQALADAITRNATVHTLEVGKYELDKLPQKAGRLLGSAMAGNKSLKQVYLSGEDARSLDGEQYQTHFDRWMGPFAHLHCEPWQPALWSRRRWYLSAFYGIRPFSLRALGLRLFWIILCGFVAALPIIFGDSSTPLDGVDAADTNTELTRRLTLGTLRELCGGANNLPLQLEHAYVDAIVGFGLVLSGASVWVLTTVVQKRLAVWCDCAATTISSMGKTPGQEFAERLDELKLGSFRPYLEYVGARSLKDIAYVADVAFVQGGSRSAPLPLSEQLRKLELGCSVEECQTLAEGLEAQFDCTGNYAGKICMDNSDGTFDVKFDNGDRDRSVPETSICKQGGGRDDDDDDGGNSVRLREGDKVEARCKVLHPTLKDLAFMVPMVEGLEIATGNDGRTFKPRPATLFKLLVHVARAWCVKGGRESQVKICGMSFRVIKCGYVPWHWRGHWHLSQHRTSKKKAIKDVGGDTVLTSTIRPRMVVLRATLLGLTTDAFTDDLQIACRRAIAKHFITRGAAPTAKDIAHVRIVNVGVERDPRSLYVNKNRADVKTMHPDLSAAEVVLHVNEQWTNLTHEEQQEEGKAAKGAGNAGVINCVKKFDCEVFADAEQLRLEVKGDGVVDVLEGPATLAVWIKTADLQRPKSCIHSQTEKECREWWHELPDATQGRLLATEQIRQRLFAYSLFVACVFGIRLWPLYIGRGYMNVLREVTRDLRIVLDWEQLFRVLNIIEWFENMTLPERWPLAIAISFAGFAGIVRCWRWVDESVSGTHASAAAGLAHTLWRSSSSKSTKKTFCGACFQRLRLGLAQCMQYAAARMDARLDSEANEGKATTEEVTVAQQTRARDLAFFVLVELLCACWALGHYFAPINRPRVSWSGSGQSYLCRAAHTGLVVFYKPLIVPLWFCLLAVLNVSGDALPHNSMTETLTFVVQALFLAWFVLCGALSVFLLVVPYCYFGLAFFAVFALYSGVLVPISWWPRRVLGICSFLANFMLSPKRFLCCYFTAPTYNAAFRQFRVRRAELTEQEFENAAVFLPASRFSGPKRGYVYTTRDKGVGYYLVVEKDADTPTSGDRNQSREQSQEEGRMYAPAVAIDVSNRGSSEASECPAEADTGQRRVSSHVPATEEVVDLSTAPDMDNNSSGISSSSTSSAAVLHQLPPDGLGGLRVMV